MAGPGGESSAISIAVGEGGNVTVTFGVFSYAGTITIAAIFDPDHFPDVDTLTQGLRTELELIVNASAASPVTINEEHGSPPARDAAGTGTSMRASVASGC